MLQFIILVTVLKAPSKLRGQNELLYLSIKLIAQIFIYHNIILGYDKMKDLQLAGIIRESIVDGPGIRMTVFTQGCPHHCEGCQNPETHSFDGGYVSHPENILKAIDQNPLLKGVTFSGGEPFMQADALADLAIEIHKRNLDIITYSGFTFEQLVESFEKFPERKRLLEQTDYLVDGKFVQELKSLNLQFRGSSNQRIIDVKKSLESGKAVETVF